MADSLFTSVGSYAEWTLTALHEPANPWDECTVTAVVSDSRGQTIRVPAYWAGGRKWQARIAGVAAGHYSIESKCSDPSDTGLHARRADLDVRYADPQDPNPLVRHGPLRMSDDGSRLVHADGAPFFWLGDTWWMLMSDRVSFPEGFRTLADDRAAHGFTVAQVVVGFPPDSTPFKDHAEDNEGGPPWEPGYERINPAYFDHVDCRLSSLIRIGIVPCVLGGWGYHLQFMTEARMASHWRYLVARYAAWPVVWCLAGETAMRFYLSPAPPDEDIAQLRTSWTRIGRIVRAFDPYHRPLTTHPRSTSWDELDDPSLLDFHMLQPGHMPGALAWGVTLTERARTTYPNHATINAEPPYEGHAGSNGPQVQRYAFWSTLLSGAAGYTYGAAGIFQANDRTRTTPNRPDGGVFDRITWDEALRFPGAAQLGQAKKLLCSLPFERFEPHPEWVEAPLRWGQESYQPPYRLFAAGVPETCRVIYLPIRWYHWDGPTVKHLEQGVCYRVTYYDPSRFEPLDAGRAIADRDGSWQAPMFPYLHDWLVVMNRIDSPMPGA